MRQHTRPFAFSDGCEERTTLRCLQVVSCCCTTHQSWAALPQVFKQPQAHSPPALAFAGSGVPTRLPKGPSPARSPAPLFPGLALTRLWDILADPAQNSSPLSRTACPRCRPTQPKHPVAAWTPSPPQWEVTKFSAAANSHLGAARLLHRNPPSFQQDSEPGYTDQEHSKM